ncbi:pitrilysin family protein [Undibacterium sp. RTI2.1]|uniref:M16 family metallopeptidase n=2 Tax=Undibacterium TaxID=401469 RepID=UPI002B2245C9|nr:MULTISPECIES: pitrilysin family protein [unclassified Undibacterium]MEB0029611.1 pitrilysin family protein [Undibacterium sp. RTI2.1]MEB0116082.1 pitrilysin family protein [Undibacterium sp. RTI2.2]
MRLKPIVLAIALSFAVTGLSIAADTTTATSATTDARSSSAKASQLSTVEGITEYRLTNGLRVLLAPDASKPTTTVNITYLVGSRHENYGETGMAHLLEHMVFKGTTTQGNIMQELGRRGMSFNGTTFMDRTNYFETFPASDENLSWALGMEADRMVNSTILRTELDKEFSVVRNEMEMGENNPNRVLWKQLTAVTYDWHNYGHNTIGARSDVENVKIENLKAFYRKYYQPDNAVLVVTGKFNIAATLAMIESKFGAIAKPSRVIEPTYTMDAPRDGAREITVNRISDTQLIAVLYPTAAGAHPDSAAIAALGDILGNTPNGRLHKAMVEQKKAVNTSAWVLDLAEPGYIIFWSELSKTQSIPEARRLLLENIESLKKHPITEAELKRAKSSMLNDIDKTINDAQRLAIQLSESIAKGDWRLFFISRDRIEALTVADVQRAAENYFKETNRTFGQFVPVKTIDRTDIPVTPDVNKLVAGYQGRAAVAEGEAFDVSTSNIDKRTQKLSLSNGMKLALISKKTRANAVSGQIVLEFGDEKSLFGQTANADLAADMLMYGAGKLSRAEIATQFDALKAKVRISGQGQNLTVRFDTIRKNLPEVLALIRDVLRSPTFPATEFEQLRNENLTQIEASKNEPNAVGAKELARAINQFKKGDIRYTPTFEESIAEYKNAKLPEVKRFYETMYGANQAQMSLVGDFDAKEVETQMQSLFGNWNSRAKFTRLSNPAPEVKPAAYQLETADKANAFYVATLPLKIQDNAPDYPALSVINNILGGSTQSRLLARLRQKDGLSYGAGSQIQASSFESSGSVTLYAIYAPQNLEKIKLGVKEELERFVRDGITEQELADAKKSIMQQRQTSRAQDAALVGAQINNLKTGRNMSFYAESDANILALTVAQANAAIKKYIDPSMFLHVYAGDFAGASKKAAESAAAAAK